MTNLENLKFINKKYTHVPHLLNPSKETLKYCHSLLVFDPYGGCSHNCVYCYSKMGLPLIHNQNLGSEIHIRKNTIKLLENFLKKYHFLKFPIRISSSNDPLQPCEEIFNLTYRSLKLLLRYDYPAIICTKGKISEKILVISKKLAKKKLIRFQISLGFCNEKIISVLEPNCPLETRIEVIQSCIQSNIPISIRYQPIIPFYYNNESIIRSEIQFFKNLGVKHIIASFIKLKKRNMDYYTKQFKGLQKIKDFNFKKFSNPENWERGGFYLKPAKKIKENFIKILYETCLKEKTELTTCKEGFWKYHTIEDCCGGIYERFSDNWWFNHTFSKKLIKLFSNYPNVHKFGNFNNKSQKKITNWI